MEYQDYFNKEEALHRVRGNEKTLCLMITMFLSSKEIEQLEASLEAKDIERAARKAHAVKGLAGNLSFPLLYKVSAQLNQELKQEQLNEGTVAEYYKIIEATQAAAKALCEL